MAKKPDKSSVKHSCGMHKSEIPSTLTNTVPQKILYAGTGCLCYFKPPSPFSFPLQFGLLLQYSPHAEQSHYENPILQSVSALRAITFINTIWMLFLPQCGKPPQLFAHLKMIKDARTDVLTERILISFLLLQQALNSPLNRNLILGKYIQQRRAYENSFSSSILRQTGKSSRIV